MKGARDGIPGRRVSDSSIMANCIRANTHVTTMMIGELVSDFVRQGNQYLEDLTQPALMLF